MPEKISNSDTSRFLKDDPLAPAPEREVGQTASPPRLTDFPAVF